MSLRNFIFCVMEIEKEKEKDSGSHCGKVKPHRNIYMGTGYLSWHISVIRDTESLFLSLLIHSHVLESTGEMSRANSPGEDH